MQKLFFIASIIFAEQINVAQKYPLIYKAMQTEQGANNLVGITESNYESKTKDMKENIFMQPAKNIIWFNDFIPWNPIFVVKIGNHYVPFFKKSSCLTYLFIILLPINYYIKKRKLTKPQLKATIFLTSITFAFHIIESVATTYYNMSPVKTEEQLFKTLNYNSTKAISITFFTINIIWIIILAYFNIEIYIKAKQNNSN